MKALLKKASDWDYHKIIEINSLDDLLKIYHSLIIETKPLLKSEDYKIKITIYDDYVE